MIHIDLGLPTRVAMLQKIVGDEKTFSMRFKARGKAKVLPRVLDVAVALKNSFETVPGYCVNSVKLDLIYKDPKNCDNLPAVHKFLVGVSGCVNDALGGPVRELFGANHTIVKGMSTHFEIGEKNEIEIKVTYRLVKIEDLIDRAEPYIGSPTK